MDTAREKWIKMIGEFDSSGMSNVEFVKAKGINTRTFQWWKWQVHAFQRTGAWPSNGHPTKKSTTQTASSSVLPPEVGEEVKQSEPVTGYRRAAEILGVSKNVVYKLMARNSSKENAPITVIAAGNNHAAFGWRDEKHLKAWWEEINSSKLPMTEEAMIVALLGEEILSDLHAFRQRLDTPEVQVVRASRGEESSISLAEILSMVVGLGIANWPLE